MKVFQPKLSVGMEGNVLIDATNLKSKSNLSSKKRKSDNVENLKPTKIIRRDGIYSDPPVAVKNKNFVDSSVQTEPLPPHDETKDKAQQIKDMLTREEPPPEYWESLAERRRQALEVSLEENRSLRDENEFLKGENQILEDMLEEAKQLATLVKEMTDENLMCGTESTSGKEEESETTTNKNEGRPFTIQNDTLLSDEEEL